MTDTNATTVRDAAQAWLDWAYPASPDRAERHHVGVLDARGSWSGAAYPRDQVAAAIAAAEQGTPQGVYLGACTYRPEAGHGRKAVDTAFCYGLWSDLDIAGPGHKHDPAKYDGLALPPDEVSARKVVDTSGLPEPTAWVHSGGGLYAWWMFDQPVPAAECAEMSRQTQAALARAAAALGWHYGTGVSDLARVLRVPGTVNRKAGLARQCVTLSADGPRYAPASLGALLATLTPAPEARPAATDRQPAGPTSPRIDEFFSAPGDSVLAAFDRSVTWVQVLQPFGWQYHHRDVDGTDNWTRPGKTPEEGSSATTGHTAADTMKCFSDDPGVGLPTKGTLTKAFVWAALTQGRPDPDLHVAAAQLRRAGYGQTGQRAADTVAAFEAGGMQPIQAEIMPPPSAPMDVARVVEPDLVWGGVYTLLNWRGGWWRWQVTHWAEIEDLTLRKLLYARTEHARFLAETKDGPQQKKWSPDQKKVSNLADALSTIVHLDRETWVPSWLRDQADLGAIVSCRNGLLQLAGRVLLPHDAAYFNLVAVPFDFEPAASAPMAWLEFLEMLWPNGGAGQVAALQEWFGYVISGRTDQQKIFAIIGPPRSGKGTIAAVLTALAGAANVTGPTLASLAGEFGLQPLLRKSLALISDARIDRSSSTSTIVERLLTISGEDTLSVNRKHKEAWEGRIPARIMLLSNELPRFSDSSGTIATRFVIAETVQSFLGREDRGLRDRLLAELPGILNWALTGLERLLAQGHFTATEVSTDAVAMMRQSASPYAPFVDEMCVVGPQYEASVDVIWTAWKAWCFHNDRREAGIKNWLGRDLKSVVPGLRVVQPRDPNTRKQYRAYRGLALKADNEELVRVSEAPSGAAHGLPPAMPHPPVASDTHKAIPDTHKDTHISAEAHPLPSGKTRIDTDRHAHLKPTRIEEQSGSSDNSSIGLQWEDARVYACQPAEPSERAADSTPSAPPVDEPNYCPRCARTVSALAWLPCDRCDTPTHARGRGGHGTTCDTCLTGRTATA